MQITFRKIKSSDEPSCTFIMKRNYFGKESKKWEPLLIQHFLYMLDDLVPIVGLVAIYNNNIIGFGSYETFTKECTSSLNVYAISWMNIPPNHQRKGIGRLLVFELENHLNKASQISFNVKLQTDKPIFYEKLGYKTFKIDDGDSLMHKSFIK